MAITTRDRRASCLAFDLPFRVWPNPDGSLASQADRQQIAWKYPGIAASGGGSALLPRLTLLGAGCWLLWMVS